MKTTYLIWKNPYCDGISPDWQEITGQEFYALVKSQEGKSRHFVKLESPSSDANDGRIVMEATKDEYRKWRKEKDHSDLVREGKQEKGYITVSYNALGAEDGDSYGEELLRDDSCDIEAECLGFFEREAVKSAISRLSMDEQRMIEYLYISDKPGTERGYSALTSIPQKTINDRKNHAIAKMKKLLKK